MMKDVIEYNERVCREFVESQKKWPKDILRDMIILSSVLNTPPSPHTEHKTSQ